GGVQGFTADLQLESCRRLVQSSCRGREGYVPPSTVAAIGALAAPGRDDVLVIGAGYDDWSGRFAGDFDAVVAAARARGFHQIVWVTYRANVTYHLPSSTLQSNYAAMNAMLAGKAAS